MSEDRVTEMMYVDGFPAAVCGLSRREKKNPISVLKALEVDPMLTLWDWDSDRFLQRTIGRLKEGGLVMEVEQPYPWYRFELTKAGKQALEEAKVMKKFWIVMRDQDATRVMFRHASEEEAKAEAERLSKKEKARFFVLEVTAMVEPMDTPVEWKTINE
jgi:hypothetical protein